MTTRMLIDARHPEETRVAVVSGTRIEEFDFEAAARKQIKGNIYLAKVTRVEPSLQAAFIEYGGNRHGFLAFSEIHPDYYQIPREDRERLLREERALEDEAADDRGDDGDTDDDAGESEPYDNGDANGDAPPPPAPVETGGADDHHGDRLRERRMALRRRYKIQDVIKRRQVLLVQVVKEERGNKGAALTTYLSLAGRYSVLMPNTSSGGGISRKISSAADRKRLKSIMDDLRLPPGMAAIVRTAGLARTKTEIKRDFDYLTRLWDDIREGTLAATAPALIHEDSDLIKRAIRDIYTREIDEVLVEGDDGYAHAREFMKLLMPTHAKRVKQYVDPVPLFQRGQVEGQLNAMFQPVVQLRSGGYLVINQTEALVAVDINSGRSTREHNIEETAYKTNCEAADEIARQLRLRDLAGLIVIDFIDMESNGNVRRVERAMKEALKNDRARIQVGRISGFGLLEMSRQRLRTGVLEASTHACPTCEGSGWIRSVPSAALAAIRGLEEEAVRGRHSLLTLRAAADVAFYILNRKRAELTEIEERYGVRIEVTPDEGLSAAAFGIEGAGPAPEPRAMPTRPMIVAEEDDDVEDEEVEDEEFEEEAEPVAARPNGAERAAGGGERSGRKRRRRRGGRRGEGRAEPGEAVEAGEADNAGDTGADVAAEPIEAVDRADDRAGAGSGRRRRRGRRGGRRPEGEAFAADALVADDGASATDDAPASVSADEEPDVNEPIIATVPEVEQPVSDPADPEPAPAKPARRTRARKAEPAEAAPVAPEAVETPAPRRARRKAVAEPAAEAEAAAPAPKPARKPRARKAATAPDAGATALEDDPTAAGPATADKDSAGEGSSEVDGGRKGWWQRTFG